MAAANDRSEIAEKFVAGTLNDPLGL